MFDFSFVRLHSQSCSRGTPKRSISSLDLWGEALAVVRVVGCVEHMPRLTDFLGYIRSVHHVGERVGIARSGLISPENLLDFVYLLNNVSRMGVAR